MVEHAATQKRAARLMEWIPTKPRPRPHIEPTPRKLEVTALYGPAIVHWRAWFSALTLPLSGAQTEQKNSKQKSTKNWSRSIAQPGFRWTHWFSARSGWIFPWVPTKDDCSHLDQSWIPTFLVCQSICKSRNSSWFSTTKCNRDSRPWVPYRKQQHLRANNVLHGSKRWFQRSHQVQKTQRGNSEVVSVSTMGRLQEI